MPARIKPPLLRALAGVLLLVGCGAVPSTDAAAGSAHGAPAMRPHVFLIVMENQDWSAIKGSTDAPYINHTLLALGAHADRYYNPPGIHPSLPNYLWLEAGTSFGISDDADSSGHRLTTTRHLTALLARAHRSWRAYEDGISGRDCPLMSRYPYAAKHDPFVYFADVTNGFKPTSRTCVQHIRPISGLQRDLASGNVADYTFITPNLCNDMHDLCPPLFNRVRQGDTWLSQIVPLILRSAAYRANGVLFITWDEGEGNDGPIGFIALSPLTKRGFASRRHYTHSSTLRTIEEILSVRPYLGGAAAARDMRDLFKRLP